MKVLTALTMMLMTAALPAVAQTGSNTQATGKQSTDRGGSPDGSSPCPNPRKIRNMCMAMTERTLDKEPVGRYRYLYQRKILEAACVDIGKDDEQVVAQKVQKAWKTFENELICNSLQFDIINGSIIKFAVSQNFESFLMDLAKWRVDMNKVDADDGGTVLDYIQNKINTVPSTDMKLTLRGYYEMLRRAGAKHRFEL